MGYNGVPLINGVAYTWSDIVLTIAGVPVTGISAIDYEDKQEVKNNYGAGRYPVSRGKGKIECTAKITLKMDEVVAIAGKALNGRMQDIAAFDIAVTYIPESGIIVTDFIKNCQFMTNKRTWKQGDTDQEVDLELIVSHIVWGK